MKKLIILLALLINTPTYALVGDNNIHSTEKHTCTTNKVIGDILTASVQKQSEVAENSNSELKAIEKISKNAKDPKKSIGEQLSVKDSEAFSESSQRIGAMNMVIVVESNYERDLIAIEKLIKIVDDYYYYGKVPDMKSRDAFYFELLLAWRKAMHKKINVEPSISKQCTLDTALYNKEISPLMDMSKSSKEFIVSWERIRQLMSKYNMKNFDYDKLNIEDKHEVLVLREKVFLPMEKERFYVMDIMNIRHFAVISKLVYDSNLKDILTSGGDSNYVGNTINKLITTHQLDAEDQKMLSAWRMLEEKIPSRVVKNFKMLGH